MSSLSAKLVKEPRAPSRVLDQPTSVTPGEERALEEVARALHIDHGSSWAALLAVVVSR